jgi:PAS domain S-box-containing protein
MAQRDEFLGDGIVSPDAILDGTVGNDTALLDAIDLPIIVISRDCTVALVNRAATTVLGLKTTDVGRTIRDSLPSVENLDRLCARVIADGAPHRIETRVGDRSFLLRIAPYAGKDRLVLGSVLTFTNITAFRASIDQAIYEREYTKAILNAVIDPLVVLDDKLRVQTANRAFHTLFGISRDKAQGISIRQLGNHEWETSEAWASVEASLSNHTQLQAIEIEGELPTVGRRTFVLDAYEFARDQNALILLTFHDVTERKQAERTTSLLAAIVDNSDDAILSKKLDGTITSWNKSAEGMFGYTPKEAIGQHITLIVPWERRSEEEGILRRLAQGERVDHFETVRKRKNGTTLDLSLTISPIHDAAGRVIGASNVARDITERKRIEQALQKSEKKYREFAETATIALHWVSSDGTIIWANQAELEMLGYSSEEYIGHNISEFHVDAPVLQDILNRLFRGERIMEYEARLRAKDGSLRQVIIDSSALFEEGKFVHTRCFTRDVSERKQAEELLRQSEERFRAIVETTPECVKLVSADGTLLLMNSSGLRMLGARRAEEVVGKSIYNLVVPEDRERYQMFNESICRGEQGSLQFQIIGLDGKRRHMETHAAPLRNPDGIVVHLAVTSDISQRIKADRALRESEQRYRVVTEAAPIMVWMSGLDKLCYYFNKGWLDFVGRPLEREVGHGWAENVHPDDFDRCLQLYLSCFDARRPFEMQYRLRHHSGQYRWILDRGVPRYASDGTFEGYVGGCLDIHDQKTAEEKARRADVSFQLMKTQDEERRHIARELHDTAGQTLTVLGLHLAELVQLAGQSAPELAREAKQIEDAVQQLHREIRTASYLLHPPLLDEAGLNSAISWYVEGLLERSGLDVHLDISREVGRLPRDMELAIFRLVQECLTNIHRHSGSKTASIRITRESEQVTVDIRDQGRGMSPKRLAEIHAGRSGVGIQGMRERLLQFEGTVNFESSTSGTRVFATIPVPKAESPEEQGKTERLQAASEL